MNVLFRADSSSEIGTGHIMRDLVLSEQYSSDNIIFATQYLPGNINDKILEKDFSIKLLESNDFNELDSLIKELKIGIIVIDHYGIDFVYEKRLKKSNPKLNIFSLDDTYEKHYCDILLNHNIGADPERYKALVPKETDIRCGKEYTLIRKEFYAEKQKKVKKESENINIFIAMGGADHSQINIPVLKVLSKYKNITVTLVTTSANKKIEELKEYVKEHSFVKLNINSTKIAKLMNNSDFCIVTPSVILNEVMFMEKDFIAIKTADNQKDIYEYLLNKKFDVMPFFEAKLLVLMINKRI